jgi:hypothetical protein
MKKLFYLTTICLLSIPAIAQVYFVDNFNYSTNDSLSANGWTVASGGTTNALRASATGLTYAGYVGSGVGNAVPMTTTGQDVVRDASIAISSGSIYSSFLMNVSAAQSGGDYFFGLVLPGSTTGFFARTYIRSVSNSGFFQIGVSKASTTSLETTVYQSDSLAFNTTYQVVVKYQFNTSNTQDDSVKVFVFSSGIPTTEPALGKAATIGGTNTDATSLQRVLLRQGTSTTAPTLTIDAIRVGINWGQVTLPVAFIKIGGFATEANNIVYWSTASEVNNHGFEVERSFDGVNFENIAFVKGAGHSSQLNNYQYTDATAAHGTVYYRLKQIDFDGAFTYSEVVTIKAGIAKVFQSSPNPFANELSVEILSANKTTAQIEVVDLMGKVLVSANKQIEAGNNTIELNTSVLPTGIYFIRSVVNGESHTQRIVKN